MNQEMWSKSLLASYRLLPKIVKSIDSYTMSLALGSFSYTGNTLDLMQKIIDNNKRKEALINAKVIVDTTLQDLKPKYREVLELKFIRKMSFEEIANTLGICLRTVFRRYAFGLSSFSAVCKSKGYDEEWLDKRYAKDSLFSRLNEIHAAQLQKNSENSESKREAKSAKSDICPHNDYVVMKSLNADGAGVVAVCQ